MFASPFKTAVAVRAAAGTSRINPLGSGGVIDTIRVCRRVDQNWKACGEKQNGRFEESRQARRYLFLASKLSHATQFVSLKESSSWSNASVCPLCWPSRSSPWPPRVPKPVCSAASRSVVNPPAAPPLVSPAAVPPRAAASRAAVRLKAAVSPAAAPPRAAASRPPAAASVARACSSGCVACSSGIAARATAALRLAASPAAALRAAAATKQTIARRASVSISFASETASRCFEGPFPFLGCGRARALIDVARWTCSTARRDGCAGGKFALSGPSLWAVVAPVAVDCPGRRYHLESNHP